MDNKSLVLSLVEQLTAKYGINFNQALETGGVMLGKNVKFEASAEFSIDN